jgi:uncharacterized protein (TIGR00375 family)
MRIIADLHIHSRFSRACSRDMEVESLARWAKIKGVNLLGTGDFTHPTYLADLKKKLNPLGNGLFQLRQGEPEVAFMLTVEVTNIYHQAQRLRKIHTLIFAPSFAVVDKLNARLSRQGNLAADGRPTFTCSARDLLHIVLDTAPECFFVPAHAWTPWFSVFGSNSGFDSLAECFGEEVCHIKALETGLSSDPEMNWRLSALDDLALISNSDAHSPRKIAREATVLDCEMSYDSVMAAITSHNPAQFLFTIEFFPAEGKYHFDGHRNCNVLLSPAQTTEVKGICPQCGRKLTVGVMNRVNALADRKEGYIPTRRIPGKHLIPLEEIIAEALGKKPGTKGVENEYQKLIHHFGWELRILLDLDEKELSGFIPPRILTGIMNMRQGKVKILPGYDGVFGKLSLFAQEEAEPAKLTKPVTGTKQLSLFDR